MKVAYQNEVSPIRSILTTEETPGDCVEVAVIAD